MHLQTAFLLLRATERAEAERCGQRGAGQADAQSDVVAVMERLRDDALASNNAAKQQPLPSAIKVRRERDSHLLQPPLHRSAEARLGLGLGLGLEARPLRSAWKWTAGRAVVSTG